jgi:hypothetical protein
VGAGSGGRIGELPPSAVELVENAGELGCSDASIWIADPSSALTAAGGDEGNVV